MGGVGARLFVLAQFFPRPSFPTTMESSSGWCRGAILFAKYFVKFSKGIVSPQTGWCSTCFASKCRCSSTSRGEDQSHHGARANHKRKHQGAHQGMKALLCHPLPGGFSGVQETSFNNQHPVLLLSGSKTLAKLPFCH